MLETKVLCENKINFPCPSGTLPWRWKGGVCLSAIPNFTGFFKCNETMDISHYCIIHRASLNVDRVFASCTHLLAAGL